jgi:hypothetical protein
MGVARTSDSINLPRRVLGRGGFFFEFPEENKDEGDDDDDDNDEEWAPRTFRSSSASDIDMSCDVRGVSVVAGK